MTTALIPVKGLEQSKSRLLAHLTEPERQALTLAMLEDLIETLSATRGIDHIAVATPDRLVAERARAAGAEAIVRAEPGLNAALEDAIVRLAPDPDEGLLIVLGDVAGALAEDVARLLDAADRPGPGVWVAPSIDGGSSAMLQRPAGVIACRYGADSAKRHREAAESAGVGYHEVALPSLAIDLDDPDDLDTFLESHSGGPRTRALLATLRRERDPGAANR